MATPPDLSSTIACDPEGVAFFNARTGAILSGSERILTFVTVGAAYGYLFNRFAVISFLARGALWSFRESQVEKILFASSKVSFDPTSNHIPGTRQA